VALAVLAGGSMGIGLGRVQPRGRKVWGGGGDTACGVEACGVEADGVEAVGGQAGDSLVWKLMEGG